MKQVKIAVLGGGSWGTAIVKMLSENLEEVGWYVRNNATKKHILTHRHNPDYLSAVTFDIEKLKLSTDINQLIKNADYLIFAIPSAFLEKELSQLSIPLKNKVIFSAIKGIVPESGLVAGEHFNKKYAVPYRNIGIIAGPCHAEEVALERLSYLTIASKSRKKANTMASYLKSHYIKTSISSDVIGTEYAAVLKNIYAIAAGIAHGLGYGDNFQSILMSNAIREMNTFIKGVYRKKRNINNSAYLGDLLVTGYSAFSRNRMFGNMLGKGYTVKSAIAEMNMIAEGYYAVNSAYKILQKSNQDHCPIIRAVYKILYQKQEAKKVFKDLSEQLD